MTEYVVEGEEEEENPKKKKKGKMEHFGEDPYCIVSGSTLQSLISTARPFYGLSPSLPLENLFTRSTRANKLYFGNSAISHFIRQSHTNNLRIINAGVRFFTFDEKINKKSKIKCQWRIMKEGLVYALPHITQRRLEISFEEFLLLLKSDQPLYFEEFKDKDTQHILEKKTEMGSVILNVNVPLCAGTTSLNFIGWRGATSLNLFVKKKELESLRNLFLSPNYNYVHQKMPSNSKKKKTTSTNTNTPATNSPNGKTVETHPETLPTMDEKCKKETDNDM